jgi:hypothetical protein
MKTKIILVATVFAALISSAQTNGIIFPQLLSPTNSVLMTNAEFRCFSGNRIIFKNDDGYQTFHAPDLNTNVLATLHITAHQLDRNQKALDAQSRQYKEQAASLQAAEAKKQYDKDHPKSIYTGLNSDGSGQPDIGLMNYNATNSSRKGWDGKHYHDNQSGGNFIGN